jgi:hypothetical protein
MNGSGFEGHGSVLRKAEDVPPKERAHGFLYVYTREEPVVYRGVVTKRVKKVTVEYKWCRACGFGVLTDFWSTHNEKMHRISRVK